MQVKIVIFVENTILQKIKKQKQNKKWRKEVPKKRPKSTPKKRAQQKQNTAGDKQG